MKSKRKNDFEPQERPPAEYWDPHLCPVCGNNDFDWGMVLDGEIQKVYFRREGAGLGGGKPLQARHCTRCGNVQIFADRGR